tara:strand:+ start:34 stop:786 length:753 start_codon:yes stop_codon:yes gene_type:complete
MSKIGAIAQSDTSIVTTGLQFNMDSSKFTCYPRTGTTCTDLVNSEDGTLTNGPTFENNNLGVIDFDGTDDLIRFSNSASPFNIPVANAIEVWYYPTGNGSQVTGNIIFNRGGDPAPFVDWGIYHTINDSGGSGAVATIEGIYGITDGTFVKFKCPNSIISLNNWYHIVMTQSATDRKIYVNNVERYSTTGTYSNGVSNAQRVDLGAWFYSLFPQYRAVEGKVPIARVYHKYLTADEVSINYNAVKERFGL